jgi:hypothetical protein
MTKEPWKSQWHDARYTGHPMTLAQDFRATHRTAIDGLGPSLIDETKAAIELTSALGVVTIRATTDMGLKVRMVLQEITRSHDGAGASPRGPVQATK